MSALNIARAVARTPFESHPNKHAALLKMSTTYLSEILQKLGWEDGFQIPVANAENQKLEEELARLSLQKFRTKTAFETSGTKLENLENHLKYVNQEYEQNQNLLTAHAQQLQSEEHKLKISVAEKAKLEQEIKQNAKKISDVAERQQVQKHQLEKYSRRLDKMKSETDWDKEALEAWEESLQKRDDDNQLIKKFSKEDERKYNELDAKRQSLELEYVNRKQTINKMVNDLTNYERILERTGKAIKQQATERSALIQQWKDSVKILHQRDAEIDRMQIQILELQEILDKESEKLDEQKEFHGNETRNNDELEHETQQLNYINSKLRREWNDLVQSTLFLHSQADTLRRTMISAANELEKERGRRKCMKDDIKSKEKQIERSRAKLVALKEKSEALRESTITASERTQHLEKLIDDEQTQQKMLHSDTEMMQNLYFRAQLELQNEHSMGKTIELDIYGATTNINHLQKHNEDQRKMLGKRKEHAYELDYKVDEVEQKILLNENVIHDEDTEELEAKLGELEAKMSEHTEVKNLLKDQVNKIGDDMRRLTLAIVNDQSQLAILKDKLQHQSLSFEGGQKQLTALKTGIQENQVEENMLRLRVSQLTKAMKKEETDIYTLQKFKLTLEQATQERMLEIDTNKDILLVKRRSLGEDKGRLKCDISERRIRLEQFKKKYDIVLMTLGTDEDGQPHSITHFKIKNAQEKFLLQQEGDELDCKIKKAEKEIIAMENTLKIVNLTNAAFKTSLGAVDDEGQEMIEMKRLEDQMLVVNDTLRANKKELVKKRQELEEVVTALNELQLKRDEAQKKLRDLEEEHLKIQQDLVSKDEKLKRAERCIRAVDKKIEKKEKEKYDRDLEIRELKNANQSAMQRLLEMSVRYQEVAPLITRYTIEYSVKLPAKRSLCTVSTSSESTRSSQSCKEKEMSFKSDAASIKSVSSRTTSSVSKVVISFQV